jgi:hypothetical protein
MSTPRDPDRRGRFLGLPYDLRRPSAERFRKRVWNPESHTIWAPKSFGWGYGVNMAEVARRLHLRRG